jgi:predicted nucleic acid-binding protein
MKYVSRFLFQQYVFDASSLINIERKRQVKHLRARHSEVIVPDKVAEEVKIPGYPLCTFLERYPSAVTAFNTREEDRYLEIRGQPGIHNGEAAAITLSICRELPLVIDESAKRGRGKAQNHHIHCLSSQEWIGLWGAKTKVDS